MSNFRGTRGKWEINPKASRNVRCNNLTIANCSSGQNGESEIEEKHNALLISKSPEMLMQHENDLIELQLIHDFIFNDQGYSVTNPNLIWIEKAIENKKQLIRKATEL
jgi:hypothetical protein